MTISRADTHPVSHKDVLHTHLDIVAPRLVHWQKMPLGPLAVVRAVCTDLGVNPELVLAKTRRREIVRARWVCFYVLRIRGHSFPSIARLMRMDHTAVMSGINRVDATLEQRRREGRNYAPVKRYPTRSVP